MGQNLFERAKRKTEQPSHKMATLWDFFYQSNETQNSAHYKILMQRLPWWRISQNSSDNLNQAEQVLAERSCFQLGEKFPSSFPTYLINLLWIHSMYQSKPSSWGHHRQSTAHKNGMEVETNYTCLGQKAAVVKTPPRKLAHIPLWTTAK